MYRISDPDDGNPRNTCTGRPVRRTAITIAVMMKIHLHDAVTLANVQMDKIVSTIEKNKKGLFKPY